MADSSRISLYDCMVDLKMPALSSLPAGAGGKPPSLETIAGLTADGATRDLHAAYLGETVVLVVIVHVPLGPASSRDSLFFTLDRLGETRVSFTEALGLSRPAPTRNALRREPSSPRKADGPAIPVLRESEWVQASSATSAVSRSPSGESAGEYGVVFAKALCVLLRTPPEASRPSQLAAAQGRVRIAVVARERPPPVPPVRARAAAAISRAARIGGRPLALATGKDLTVRVPLELSCAHFTAGGSATKAFVSVSAVNVSTDAVLSVAPPFVHVTASCVTRERGRKGRGAADEDGAPIVPFDINTGTYLDEAYDFVPCFDAAMEAPAKEDQPFGAHSVKSPIDVAAGGEWTEVRALSEERENLAAFDDDLGLFIPASCLARKSTVQLAPQEEFNFVYEITPRGCTSAAGASTNPTSAADSSQLGTFAGVDEAKVERTENQRPLPRLTPGTVFETSVAVAWSCASRDALDAVGAPGAPLAAESPALERAFSSGGVLALGERRSVAVREVSVQWRPPALVEDVVVSFAGPRSATVREHVPVTVTVRNQASKDLNSASLYVQRGVVPNTGYAPLLTPLRTAVALGRIPAGGSARVELLCVALKAGALTLGDVKVVDLEADGVEDAKDAPVWCAQSSFEVFVVDSNEELRKGAQAVTVSGRGQQ